MNSRALRPRRIRTRSYQWSRKPSGSGSVRSGRSLRLRSSFISFEFQPNVIGSSCHIAIRIGNAKGRQRLDLKIFHQFRLRLDLMVVAEEMQNAVNDQMGKMMAQGPWIPPRPPAPTSRTLMQYRQDGEGRRYAGRPAPGNSGAGKDSTLVALSFPRQVRFSSRICASSVSITLTSKPPRRRRSQRWRPRRPFAPAARRHPPSPNPRSPTMMSSSITVRPFPWSWRKSASYAVTIRRTRS